MAEQKLAATQQAFLNALFGPARGKLKEAAKIATGQEDYSQFLTDDLLAAIKKRADGELTLAVPKALFMMTSALEDPENSMFIDKLHKIAADILDRAGVSKQERPVSSQTMIGIVMLPNKMELPPPPSAPELPVIDADVKALFDARVRPDTP